MRKEVLCTKPGYSIDLPVAFWTSNSKETLQAINLNGNAANVCIELRTYMQDLDANGEFDWPDFKNIKIEEDKDNDGNLWNWCKSS